jgi:copper chaperone CopZ
MYSTFYISKSQCMTCNNEVLKQLGTLRGVFGAEMDRIDGKIEVNHTDEISREEIGLKLDELGWKEILNADNDQIEEAEPSIWGCTL